MPRCVVMVLVVVFAGAARADEGVREINQASVSGAAGALHVISAPGSYRLTSNLLAPTGSSGIRIDVSDVTLDLNGFTIAATAAPGTTHGITGTALTNVEIRNGTVRDFSTSGVHLPSGVLHRVIDVRVLGNGLFGINIQGTGTSGGHLVRGCTASGNGSGVRVLAEGSLVLDSVARNNTGTGFILDPTVGFARIATTGNGVADISGGNNIGCSVVGVDTRCP
jgi:hypothetical protein